MPVSTPTHGPLKMRKGLCWRRLTVSLVTLVFLPSVTAGAQEAWPRFRGMNGTGVSATRFPTQWSDKDYAWQVKLPGMGHSSPVIWQDRLFVLSADPQDATRYVLCFDTKSGTKRWQRTFTSSPHHIHSRNSFASPTPAADADHVYCAWATPAQTTFMALDHEGKTVWQRELGPFPSQHGFGVSPIVYQDMVILCVQKRKPERNGPRTNDSFILAVDRRTGKTRWRTERQSEVASYATPFILRRPEQPDELICCSTAHGIFSLDPQTGRENWAIDVFTMRTVSSPIEAGGRIFGTTGSGGGGNYVVAIEPGPQARIVYRVERQAPYVPSVVAKDDLAFLWYDKGIVTCIRAQEGKPLWTKRVGGNYSGSPIIAGNRLYCIDEEGTVVVLAAEDHFQLLGKTPLGEPSRSTPAVAGGRMFLRTYSQLFALPAED